MKTLPHKVTGQRMSLRRPGDSVSIYNVLDDQGNKIPDGISCRGDQSYKTAVCLTSNLE